MAEQSKKEEDAEFWTFDAKVTIRVMYSLQKQFHDFIQEQELLKESEAVLLAVSSGLDSMVLADLFFQSNWNFCIAHCNFNLRGEESDGDEIFVRKWAEEKQVKFHTKKFDLGVGSVQLNARNARYEWFDKLCRENGCSKIATAHHLNDSLETLLINLTRGTGIKGMTGIPPKSGKVVRPLLSVSKSQLKDYANERSLKWREDSSNEKKDYDRNLLRHEVIPTLMKLNPSLLETFINTAERLRSTNEIVQSRVDEIKKSNLTVQDNKYAELGLDWLHQTSDLLILSEILVGFGFNYSTVKEIYKAVGKSGKVFASDTHELTMDRNSAFLKSSVKRRSTEFIVQEEGCFQLENGSLTVEVTDKKVSDFGRNQHTAFLNADKAVFPLKIRNWEEGDRFKPLGMSGTKKVSDLLIDKKVPLALKEKVLVLVSGDEIIWLVGHQISEDFKVSDDTERILKISLELILTPSP